MDFNKLTPEEKSRVMGILSGNKVIKIKYVHNSLSVNERKFLARVYSMRDYLSVVETCVWLNRCSATVYRNIKAGKIVAKKAFSGKNAHILVDVKRTKRKLNL